MGSANDLDAFSHESSIAGLIDEDVCHQFVTWCAGRSDSERKGKDA